MADPKSKFEVPELNLGSFSTEAEMTEALQSFVNETTSGGLYPLVAYSVVRRWPDKAKEEVQDTSDGDLLDDVDPELEARARKAGAKSEMMEYVVIVMTTNIMDLSNAIAILQEVSDVGYNLGKSHRPSSLTRLRDGNPHVFRIREALVSTTFQVQWKYAGRMIGRYGAPLLNEKGFSLIDICGFSQMKNSDQLAALYSLTNMLDSSIRRCARFCDEAQIGLKFGRNSTGDGYYFWHEGIGMKSDIVTFLVLIFLMSQCEVLEQDGFPLQVKGTFFIGSCYLFYDSSAKRNPRSVASNAIGYATNGAARLMSAAKPKQLLVNDFKRKDQGAEQLTTEGLIAHVNQLIRSEGNGAATLSINPSHHLRVTDKHDAVWYCFNVSGMVPYDTARTKGRIKIGLDVDPAKTIESVLFRL